MKNHLCVKLVKPRVQKRLWFENCRGILELRK